MNLRIKGYILGIIAIIYLLGFVLVLKSQAIDLNEDYGIPFVDVNKTWQGDNLTCGMAAVANAMAASEGFPQQLGEALYKRAKRYFGNKAITTHDAIEFYMGLKKGWKGLPAWKKYNRFQLVGIDLNNIARRIRGELMAGKIIILVIKDSKGNHAVTVYGLEVIIDKGYCVIKYADSDDQQIGPSYAKLFYKDGYWWVTYPDDVTGRVVEYTSIMIALDSMLEKKGN